MPGFKGLIKAMGKPFRWMFRCVKPQKDEDDCPGLPEVMISYAEEFPESLASRSRISLTDSESDTCPAEADLGPRSDSLEGIPEMLMAESLPSLMDLGCHDPCPTEAKPNPTPASDGLPQPQVTDAEEASPETLSAESLSSLTDKEDDPCPTEGDPGPKTDRVPEPQGRTSDKKRSHLVFDEDAFNSSPTEENVHKICKMFPKFSKEDKWKFADSTALKHLDLILEHFLASQETACDQLMYAVLASPRCNRDKFMNEFIIKVNEYQMEDSEELPLAKVKALKGIRAIVADLSDIKDLKYWLQYHLVTQASVLVSQFQPKEQGSSVKLKKYIVPGESIDILAILLQRLDLMHNMKSTLISM